MSRNWLNSEGNYKSLIVLGGIFFVALLCVSGVLLFAAYEGIIDGGTASLGTSVLLVVLTGTYAFITLWMTYETKQSRQQAVQPVLEFQPREYRSTIVNLGNGPARKIDLTLTFEPKGDSHQITWHSLIPHQEVVITTAPFSMIADREYLDLQLQATDRDLEETQNDDFWEGFDGYPYEQLHMTGSCEDIWGNTEKIDEQYDVRTLTETVVDTAPPMTR